MEMFITHLAMAGRAGGGSTEENPMDEDLLESMKEEPNYEKALKLLERLLGETESSVFKDRTGLFLPFTYVIFYHKKRRRRMMKIVVGGQSIRRILPQSSKHS